MTVFYRPRLHAVLLAHFPWRPIHLTICHVTLVTKHPAALSLLSTPGMNDRQPSPKKRKLSRALTTSASQTMSSPAPIELTPIEKTLRLLLLDVAESLTDKGQQGGGDAPGRAAPLELRFTGGWVRDKLLGVDSQDIDVGISTMTGYQFGLAMQDYLKVPGNLDKYKNLHTNDKAYQNKIGALHKIEANPEKSKHLETVNTRIFGLDVDLVNLRKETYSEKSRNPQMEFGTPEEDALRRDATVNALFYNLHTDEVEDFTTQGLDDMALKIIRTPLPPYQTFKDDPLRVLRLIRFASRLNYRIDPQAEQAMGNPEIKEALNVKISRERVGKEIEKMLKGIPYCLLALSRSH
jgi:tRNA nucleotidyltransferase (CCA-adding enzyme)